MVARCIPDLLILEQIFSPLREADTLVVVGEMGGRIRTALGRARARPGAAGAARASRYCRHALPRGARRRLAPVRAAQDEQGGAERTTLESLDALLDEGPAAAGEGVGPAPPVEEEAPAEPAAYVKPQMSAEQREKLRQEYLGLGGSANTKMGQNWFVNISLFIALLAIFVKITGTIDL